MAAPITVLSDRTWKYQFGPLLENDLLMGEAYDARLEMPGWDAPGFDDKRWLRVELFDDPGTALVATNGPTVRRIEELAPIADPVTRATSSGRATSLTWGRTWSAASASRAARRPARPSRSASPRCSTPTGEIYTANLRTARATDYYTFKGDGEEVWEPKFTFHGFRYVELVGYPGPVDPRDDHRHRAPLRHDADGQLRVFRAAAQPAPAQHRVGPEGQLSSTCPPTARSATSGWAGPATSRSLRAPPPSTWTWPAS